MVPNDDLPAPSAGPTLFPVFDGKGKFGFIDATGAVVVTPQFDEVDLPAEGLFAFRSGDKWGYASATGKVVIAPKWQLVSRFSEGLAAVVDRVGNDVIDDQNYVRHFCGYIDKSGAYVIPAEWRKSCGSFGGGLAAVELDWLSGDAAKLRASGWLGYIDRQGKMVIPAAYQSGSAFYDGVAQVDVLRPGEGLVRTLIDARGNTLPFTVPAGWKLVGGFAEKRARVRHADGRWGSVDLTGKLVWSAQAEELATFSEGLAAVKIGGKYGYVDRAGKQVIAPAYTCAEPFSDGLARVCASKGDERYVDRTGKEVLSGEPPGPRGPFAGGLQYRLLRVRTINETPGLMNIYGYRNKSDQYVWLSPGADQALDADWIKKKYTGKPLK